MKKKFDFGDSIKTNDNCKPYFKGFIYTYQINSLKEISYSIINNEKKQSFIHYPEEHLRICRLILIEKKIMSQGFRILWKTILK